MTRLSDHAIAILSDARLLEAARYLTGPPISADDLKVVANVRSLAPGTLRANPDLAQRLMETVLLGLDRQRFPWLHDDRAPTDEERRAAILASAAMLASQRVAMDRRNEGKTDQENRVEEALLGQRFAKVQTRTVKHQRRGSAGGRILSRIRPRGPEG